MIETEYESQVIRIRGLPWSASKEDIFKYLQDYHLKNGMQGIHIPTSKEGRNIGEAYLEFESPEEAEKFLENSSHKFENTYIEVFRSKLNEKEWAMHGYEEEAFKAGKEKFFNLPRVGSGSLVIQESISEKYVKCQIFSDSIQFDIPEKMLMTLLPRKLVTSDEVFSELQKNSHTLVFHIEEHYSEKMFVEKKVGIIESPTANISMIVMIPFGNRMMGFVPLYPKKIKDVFSKMYEDYKKKKVLECKQPLKLSQEASCSSHQPDNGDLVPESKEQV